MSLTDEQFEDTLKNLRKLAQSDDLRESERQSVAGELDEIEAMLAKLERGEVRITAFGEVSTGKSSLLNAMIGKPVFTTGARHGVTTDLSEEDWAPARREFKGIGESKLVVVDTPGINEVDGGDRAALAEKTVRYADLVLFVTDGDLNQIEFDALKTLHELNKPILLVLNKIDLYRQHQSAMILDALTERTGGMLTENEIVFAAGDPGPAVRLIPQPDGSEKAIEVERAPIVEELEARILEILSREGKAVVALNASLFASEVSERIAILKIEARGAEADRLIYMFLGVKALAVALNPIPIADILGGMAADAYMVRKLSLIYGQEFSADNARRLVRSILGAWGVAATAEWAAHLVAGLVKGSTFGLGTVLTAIPQGLVAAWATYVIGQAAKVYFRDGGWGDRGPKAVIQDILDQTDRDSVLAPLKDKLRARIRPGDA
jgi:small GTP-binding protein